MRGTPITSTREFSVLDPLSGIWTLSYKKTLAAFPNFNETPDPSPGTWEWYLASAGSAVGRRVPFEAALDGNGGGLLLGPAWGGGYRLGQSAGRIYYELFDGLREDDVIQGLWLRIATGGSLADAYRNWWRYSIYGREYLSGPNLVTLRRDWICRYGPVDEWGYPVGTWPLWNWRNIYLPVQKSLGVRCIVIKVEAMVNDSSDGQIGGWNDQQQFGGENSVPFGIRIRGATVHASDLKGKVTSADVLRDIVSPYYDDPHVPATDRKTRYDQIAFNDLPFDRWDAVDDVCAMTGWDYGVWGHNNLSFKDPDNSTTISIPKNHAGVKWDHGPDETDVFNAVRVQYNDPKGKAHEVIQHNRKLKLGGDVVADTIQAPDSVRSKAGAIRVAKRWLKAHGRVPQTGDITLTGIGPWGDALKVRPTRKIGREPISHVSLNVLDWTATLQFGVNVDTYEAWLARLAAAARPKKR